MKSRLVYLIELALLLLLLASPTLARPQAAPTADTFKLSWWSIDGGGTMNASAGVYSLSGTIGQADAGALSSGTYTLMGGFWGGAALNYAVFLPVVLKN
jgi:hypothetical protein